MRLSVASAVSLPPSLPLSCRAAPKFRGSLAMIIAGAAAAAAAVTTHDGCGDPRLGVLLARSWHIRDFRAFGLWGAFCPGFGSGFRS